MKLPVVLQCTVFQVRSAEFVDSSTNKSIPYYQADIGTDAGVESVPCTEDLFKEIKSSGSYTLNAEVNTHPFSSNGRTGKCLKLISVFHK
jgi:hypothetical protein